jgi:4-alpha-glucanotransferase
MEMKKRAAAILLPLFSLRNDDDLGRGTIHQLRPFAQWMLELGHRMVQLLPLSESAAGENSPYSALSVFSIDPLYISTDGLAGVPAADLERARAQVAGRRSIPRTELRALKFPLLAAAFAHFQAHGEAAEQAEFKEFTADNHHWLDDYALFRALKDRFNWADWKQWPEDLRGFKLEAIAAARKELDQPIAMYRYWQFLARRQWTQTRAEMATMGAGLIGDLAFLPSHDSSDVWAKQHLFMLDRLVGAPPDAFSAKGQRWGLPMPNWPRMRANNFEWWRHRARHAAHLFDMVRIDHVVGFYRTYSFSADPDAPGEFYPAAEDAQREQGEAFFTMLKQEIGEDTLIGEDLGTVPPWVRVSLGKLGVLGLKVFRWEKVDWRTPKERFIPPAQYPEQSVAVTGTHDTETVAQWWREAAAAERAQLGQAMNFPKSLVPPPARLDLALLDAILEPLYASPARLVLAPVQDLFGWEDRINLPGTIGEDNWTYRLPQTVEQLAADPAIRQRASKLRDIAQRTGRI